MQTKQLSEKVDLLLDVYRRDGAAAAQAAFRSMCDQAKDWEARALRLAFQSAIVSGAAS